jgi:transcriptional regulator with PAS, ATPase and Fis domain
MQFEVQGNFGPVLTQNQRMKEVIKTVAKVAPSECNILITGESGTGKNLLARAIHAASKRSKNHFVSVNCIAIPDTLIEAELFGHEKGAFTDACQLKRGYFELAQEGSIFLDEIGDMSAPAQGKILQAVEEKKIRRVGGETSLGCDVRVIAATNQNLPDKVRTGAFREDLFYRLNEVTIHLPPLRERKEDLSFLIKHFVDCYGKMYAKPQLKISDAALNQLIQYPWPGNFRELKNVIKSAVLLCQQDVMWLENFPFELTLKKGYEPVMGRVPEESQPEDYSVEVCLKKHIVSVLKQNGWNKKNAAAALHISRPRLDRYIHKWNLSEDIRKAA